MFGFIFLTERIVTDLPGEHMTPLITVSCCTDLGTRLGYLVLYWNGLHLNCKI